MKDSPHTPQGGSTGILVAMVGALFLLLLLSMASKGVNPYCGQVESGFRIKTCVGVR